VAFRDYGWTGESARQIKNTSSKSSSIFEHRAIAEPEIILVLLDAARAGADRSGEWRNWSFLIFQIQLAAERQPQPTTLPETFQRSAWLPRKIPPVSGPSPKRKSGRRLAKFHSRTGSSRVGK
jgi:hypothetical protein